MYSTEVRQIIKYSKNCGENEENLAIIMAAFGTKNVHSALCDSKVPSVDIMSYRASSILYHIFQVAEIRKLLCT